MKNFRSALSLVLALLMVFSCFAVFAAEGDEQEVSTEIVTKFSDVDSKSTAGKAISNLALMGVVTGYPDGTFLPDGNITRAEFAAICVRLANLANGLATDAVTGFTDLDGSDDYKWARPYVLMAKNQGIISGYPDGTFGAGNQVSYEEAVVMLMRMRGWDTACKTETALQQSISPATSWSYGYIKYAIQQGLTTGTNSSEIERVKPATRGTVAILANNSLSVSRLETVVDKSTGETSYKKEESGNSTGSSTNNKYVKMVSGTVTGTYLTNIGDYEDRINRYEIVVDDEMYEVEDKVLDKVDLYELIGQKVKMTYNTSDEVVTAIDIQETETTKIYSGYPGTKANFVVSISSSGEVEYANNPETYRTYTKGLSGNVIYNGKYIPDFDFSELSNPDGDYPFTNGVIEIFENRKPNLVKISNYETSVVSTASGSSITLLYKDSSSRKMELPVESDSDYFVFRRNGKQNISAASDLRRYDVLSVLESPADAEGVSIKIVEATRNSKSGSIDRINENDPTIFEVDGNHYQYNYEYSLIADGTVTTSEKVPELERGTGGVNFYFDHIGQVAAVVLTESTSSTGSYSYGYLLSMLQNDDDSDYDLEFYIMNSSSSNNKKEYGTGSKIKINGTTYKTKDEKIEELILESAADANNYGDAENLTYQQPIRFKASSSGLITEIVTAKAADIDKTPGEDDLLCNSQYPGEDRMYNSSTGFSGMNFRISSATIAFLVPNDRTKYDEYKVIKSSELTSGRSYSVEGYNVGKTSKGRADLMVVYGSIDATEFTYRTPFIIVDYIDYDDDDTPVIVGYRGISSGVSGSSGSISAGVSTNKVTVKVNTKKLDAEAKEVYNNLEKGDIVRYIYSSESVNEAIDLSLWFDASEPLQAQSGNLEDRILSVDSNAKDGEFGDSDKKNNYKAGFRLVYGTVLSHDETDKIITVTPAIADDGDEMEYDGKYVVSHKYNTSNVKVFTYSKRGGVSVYEKAENGIEDLLTYDDYSDDASVVITFTTGDSTYSSSYLRMIYIITE